VIKHYFSKIEFYITNVCNLNCNNCNRFNNYSFTGWQRWSDYEQIYQEWSNFIDIDHIVILGGEPLLNPDIVSWIYGLNKIFKRNVQILSNGTHINKVNGLYESLTQNGNWLGISWHNSDTLDHIDMLVKDFLAGDVVTIDKHHPDNQFGADIIWKDKNDVAIPLWLQNEFYKSAIIPNSYGKLTLHNSDPYTAHANCGFVKYKNYHFIKGKLYKCGPVALLPEFDKQHKFDISDADRQLLNSYEPLTVDSYLERGEEFLKNLNDPLAQCKFCPENLGQHNVIFAVSKNLSKPKV
jgi:organic radical activating enzyme